MAHVLDVHGPDTVTHVAGRALTPAERPAHQAYSILRFGFAALPILAGLDKFAHVLVDWTAYLAPAVARALPIDAALFMMIVGVIEIGAGILVAIRPSVGGYVVALWLWGIIVNLLLLPGYYDVALRDFGLSLGALALARLAAHFEGVRQVEA
jgi:hypothetical protein